MTRTTTKTKTGKRRKKKRRKKRREKRKKSRFARLRTVTANDGRFTKGPNFFISGANRRRRRPSG
jgi:hypothetical protein